jgi:hypothetical protein
MLMERSCEGARRFPAEESAMKDSLAGVSASLEVPTMVVCNGKSPAMAIIEQLSRSQCIMRSVNTFDIGATVDFNAVIHGASPIELYGRVVSRTQNGPRYSYTISLDSSPAIAAAIEHSVAVARARAGARADVQTGNGLTRASVRVPVNFPLRFSVQNGSSYDGRATNISTGGILMNTTESLAVGATLELHFLLGDVPVSVHGRIVAHQEATPNYNIAFFDIRELVKETLARFITSASALSS